NSTIGNHSQTPNNRNHVIKCVICMEALSIKRIISLGCEHVFHRTCLLRTSESKCIESRTFSCPT
ncbi:hypothetical protein PMAYCL1PPCAC_08720, partial [Pristionchus mayeri]